MELLRLNATTRSSATIPGRVVSALWSAFCHLPKWAFRKYHYAPVAEDLAAGPDYLLRDVGLSRDEIANLRRKGHPGDRRKG